MSRWTWLIHFNDVETRTHACRVADQRGDPQLLWQNSLPVAGQAQFAFYDNELSNCPLSLVDASHKF